MNFDLIKKIADKEGKVVIIEGNEIYIVSKYDDKDSVQEINQDLQTEPLSEERDESLKIEDLPF